MESDNRAAGQGIFFILAVVIVVPAKFVNDLSGNLYTYFDNIDSLLSTTANNLFLRFN